MTLHFQAKHPSGFIVDSPLQPLVFPDGAVHVTGADSPEVYDYQIAYVEGMSHDELFTLAMWAEACLQREEKTVLILPYLPGARMDRGVPNGAEVYAMFIQEMVRPDQIITIDPHSEAALTAYRSPQQGTLSTLHPARVTVFPVERIIRHEIQDPSTDSKPNSTYVGVIAPDKGARERASRAAKVMGVPVYQAGKTRDFETGNLSGFHMEDELPAEGKLLIVDDICDGGGTFIGLAQATGLPKERLDLWVTHGIFSKGLVGLFKHFGVIHTTDSYFNGETAKEHLLDAALGAPLTGRLVDHFKTHRLAPYLYAEINVG